MKKKWLGGPKAGEAWAPGSSPRVEPSQMIADYGEASSLSAISALLDCIPEPAAGVVTAHFLLIASKVLDHPDIVG